MGEGDEGGVDVAKSEARLAEIDAEIASLREREAGGTSGGQAAPSDGVHRNQESPAEYAARRRKYFDERFKELMYAFNSFLAVFWPVSATMILAALATVYINDRVVDEQGNEIPTSGGGLPSVIDETGTDTNGEKAEAAVLNALLIVGIITAATFGMVFLYYINCLKILIAWLCLSTTLLLGFSTSFMVQVAFQIYSIPFDQITFWVFFYNYAIVGVLAIFYQKGLPMLLTQCYLVAVSVVMAWILLRFLPEWTSWALLVFLAMYDLCAVLTPCGPLRCLIEVSKDNERPMPGLLYEAQVSNSHQSSRAAPQATRPASEESRSLVAASSSGDHSQQPIQRPARPSAQSQQQEQQQQQEQETQLDVESMEQQRQGQGEEEGGGEEEEEFWADRNEIKLGLGDFVFYSVLVGRSALNGFATFCAVYITILAGLAGTLTLLAVFQKALPALPISIFVGVIFFFVTEFIITPMTNSLALEYTTL